MWQFVQSTGNVSRDGVIVAQGWAGQGEGRNNPELQCVPNLGPLPRGLYAITAPYLNPHTGPYTMNLVPDVGNQMCGRGDFRIHGAAYQHPELSSHGCIILVRPIREQIWASNDHNITVVA